MIKLPRAIFAVLLTTALFAVDAHAGGFDIPGFGSRALGRGAAFSVLADDPTAMWHNPGGLSRLSGFQLMLNHNLIYAPVTFTRAASIMDDPSPVNPAPGDPLAAVSNGTPLFPLNASLFLTHDFGLDDWTFALGAFGPNAVGILEFPVSGGQRYMLTRTEMLLIYYSLGAAYGKKDKYGVGLVAQWADVPVSKFSLVVDGAQSTTPTPYYNKNDLESTLDMKDPASWTLMLGGWWRVIPELELGVSGRIVPVNLNLRGKVKLATIPNQEFVGGDVTIKGAGDAALDLTLPLLARLGARYRHLDGDREVFDIELNYIYEGWSSVEDYDVKLDGFTHLSNVHKPDEDGVALSNITLGKQWKDTHSVHIGGTWNAVEDTFSWSMGGFWESGAIPKNYSNLDFMSFDRLGFGTGIQLSGWGMDFNLSYLYVHQEERTVDEKFGKVFQQRPLGVCPKFCSGLTGVPANAGKFESAYHQLNLGLVMHFDQWGDQEPGATDTEQ